MQKSTRCLYQAVFELSRCDNCPINWCLKVKRNHFQDSGEISLIELAWCISMMWRLRLLRWVQRLPHTWHLKEGSLPHSRRWCLLKCSFLQYDRSHLSQENLRSHGITSSIKSIWYQLNSLFILKLYQHPFGLYGVHYYSG